MTKQEYYDLLVKSAGDGTFPSLLYNSPDYICVYRGDLTKSCRQRCAVGLLIPNDKYNSAMEGRSVKTLVRAKEIVFEIPDLMTLMDLIECQRIHDNVARLGQGMAWNRDKFIECINELPCFYELVKSV